MFILMWVYLSLPATMLHLKLIVISVTLLYNMEVELFSI